MEGPLSKWTNVMKGWQYRWFVLDNSAGLLSYYTSKEKMVRGTRRGCVKLKGAIVGIDDEDDSTFTITDDTKTFHFQAQDSEEREKWIRSLEDTVMKHTTVPTRWDRRPAKPTKEDFDRKLTESDAYLQLLIDQAETLGNTCTTAPDNEKPRLQLILSNLNQIIESVKHCIVLLQIAKNTAFPVCGTLLTSPAVSSDVHSEPVDGEEPCVAPVAKENCSVEVARECMENKLFVRTTHNLHPDIPDVSYSSSDDDDFLDAYDYEVERPVSPCGRLFFEEAVESFPGSESSEAGCTSNYQSPRSHMSTEENSSHFDLKTQNSLKISQPNAKNTLDYDSMYDDEDEELESMESHGSIIQHLLSQVKIGMDLTKVVLPTFILERRSLLEMYADFFAHPDLFCRIADYTTPKDRMVQVLKWYLSAFHAGRKSEVAKKPYNPILGEVFKCYWDLQKSGEAVQDGPVPWATSEQLSFVAEQVSHHPPVSAFYAEHKSKRISFCGHIWTKSKFLGLSVCVNNIGQGCVSLLDLDEEYIVNFPSGYGRSILTVPWVELGGTCQITCNKTGYFANVEFQTKPFYGGKKHRINAEVFSPGEKKPFLTVDGQWNGRMIAKSTGGSTSNFVDTYELPISKKKVKSVLQQEPNESRFLWKEVTTGLKLDNIDLATGAKYTLEQAQREQAKERKELGIDWDPKLFNLEGENWVYKSPLQKRTHKST